MDESAHAQATDGHVPDAPYARIPCSYPYDTVKALLQASPNAELVLFDDGLGSCEGDILRDNGGSGLPRPVALYVSAPELCHSSGSDVIRKLPFSLGDRRLVDTLQRIFQSIMRGWHPITASVASTSPSPSTPMQRGQRWTGACSSCLTRTRARSSCAPLARHLAARPAHRQRRERHSPGARLQVRHRGRGLSAARRLLDRAGHVPHPAWNRTAHHVRGRALRGGHRARDHGCAAWPHGHHRQLVRAPETHPSASVARGACRSAGRAAVAKRGLCQTASPHAISLSVFCHENEVCGTARGPHASRLHATAHIADCSFGKRQVASLPPQVPSRAQAQPHAQTRAESPIALRMGAPLSHKLRIRGSKLEKRSRAKRTRAHANPGPSSNTPFFVSLPAPPYARPVSRPSSPSRLAHLRPPSSTPLFASLPSPPTKTAHRRGSGGRKSDESSG